MNDIRNYMVAAPSFYRYSHLASLVAGVNIECSWEIPGYVGFIKALAGFPYDLNTVRVKDSMVGQLYTEGPNGWTDFTSLKQFTSSNTSDGSINWAPLDLDAYNGDVIETPDSTYVTWQSGKIVPTAQPTNVGPVQIRVEQPATMDAGALKGLSVVIQHYYWGTTEEVNWWALGYGQVRWQSKSLSGDQYILKDDYIFDQIVAGGTPRLVPPTGLVF